MQETTLWEGSPCPLCLMKGINSKLKFFRLNLRQAALLCKHKKCPFPMSTNYPDTFVRVGRDGKIIPGSQSERGWPHEEEDDSDDSPYISDASEESVTFPDNVPEVKTLHNVSSEKTNEKGTLEVDAFDINSIDFETDDSMDTFKLRNEITSLEMEITKSVENMKSLPPHVNCFSVLNDNNEKCNNSVSVAAKASTSSNDTVCTDKHRESDVNGISCVKMNENGVEGSNNKKSGNIILHELDSATSISERLKVTKMSEELANCMQQSVVNTPNSNKCISNHKHADVQNSSNRNCRGSDGDHGDGFEKVKSNSNCTDNNVENSKPSILLIPQDMKNTVGNQLSMVCELPATSESATLKKDNDCGKEMCDSKDVVIIFNDHKNSDCDANNAGKQLDTVSMADISDPKPELPVLLKPQSMKNPIGNDSPVKRELHAELVTCELVTFNKDNDIEKEMCDNKEVVIIFDDHKNSGCSDNNAEKQLDTISTADTSNPKPELPSLLNPQSMENTVGNDSPVKRELLAELVSSESVPTKGDIDCGKKKCDDKEIDIIFDDQDNSEVYEIVTIDRDTPSTAILKDSTSYEIINVELNFCEAKESSRHSVKNARERYGKKNSDSCSDSESVTPSVKLKIVEEDGLFVCTANNAISSVSEVEKTSGLQNTPASNNAHSKNCVCFLCKEHNTKGITSHLDRALVDLFPEEYSTEKQLTERELPTEREVMRDFVHYMTGNNSRQNTKKSPKKRKRLFHL